VGLLKLRLFSMPEAIVVTTLKSTASENRRGRRRSVLTARSYRGIKRAADTRRMKEILSRRAALAFMLRHSYGNGKDKGPGSPRKEASNANARVGIDERVSVSRGHNGTFIRLPRNRNPP